jgi:hypothetical protein
LYPRQLLELLGKFLDIGVLVFFVVYAVLILLLAIESGPIDFDPVIFVGAVIDVITTIATAIVLYWGGWLTIHVSEALFDIRDHYREQNTA